MTVVLKLGGSVVTEKATPETVATDRLERVADDVAAHVGGAPTEETEDAPGAGKPGTADGLVLVHGGGSFGHHHASEHGVSTTAGTRDAVAVRAIHGAMKRLNGAVVGALAARDVPVVPVHPLSMAARADGDLSAALAPVITMVGGGFVPVLHGDVVAHGGEGATVVSGDELVAVLARADGLAVDRVGLCSSVPGVLDADGRVLDRIERFDEVADALGGSDATDVTGGMAGKVRELLALDVPASVFDVEGLEAFLSGESPGTYIP